MVITIIKVKRHWVRERSPARRLPTQIKYSSQLHFQNFVVYRTFKFALHQDFIQVQTQVSVDFMKTKSPLRLHESNKKRIIPQRKYESTYDITCGNNRDIGKHRQMKNFWYQGSDFKTTSSFQWNRSYNTWGRVFRFLLKSPNIAFEIFGCFWVRFVIVLLKSRREPKIKLQNKKPCSSQQKTVEIHPNLGRGNITRSSN